MKTVTYNPETHVLVPRDLIADAKQIFCSDVEPNTNGDCIDVIEWFNAMMAVASQSVPNPNWCAGCSPDNCSGCGAEPVDSEPAMWVMKHIRSGDLAQAKPTLHPRMWSQAHLYTTPQPDRVAELEAETTKLKLELLTSYGEAEELLGKVAELEAALKEARDGIDKFLVANDQTEFGCACDLSVGYLCGPCHADKQQQPLKSALAKINEVIGGE